MISCKTAVCFSAVSLVVLSGAEVCSGADSIGPFDRGNVASLMLTRGQSAFAFRFVADSGGLADGDAVRNNISELGPYAPDGSYARLRWRASLQNPDTFSIRWSGNFRPMSAGDYEFRIEGTGGTRVRIGEKTVIDAWKQNSKLDSIGSATLTNTVVPITVEFRSNRLPASVRLSSRAVGIGAFEVVPQVAFTNNDNVGLLATLYRDDELRVPLKSYIDPQIDDKWSEKATPKPKVSAPELTLEWSQITATNAVGKLALVDDGGSTGTVVHVPLYGSRTGASVSVSGNRATASIGGERYGIAFSEPPLCISYGQTDVAALRSAELLERNLKQPTDTHAAAAMSFVLQQNKPLYFSANSGSAEPFAPQEIERRLRLTKTRYAEQRLKTTGATAGAAEMMANLAMWCRAMDPITTSTNFEDALRLLPLAAVDAQLARDDMLTLLSRTGTNGPGIPYVLHQLYLRDRSQKAWLEQCYPAALRKFAAATTSTEAMTGLCAANIPHLDEILICGDTEALSQIAAALGRDEESRALTAEFDRRRQQLAQRDEAPKGIAAFVRIFGGVASQAETRSAVELLRTGQESGSRWLLASKQQGDSGYDPASPCEGAVMPPVNWLAYSGLAQCGQNLAATRLAESGTSLFTGIGISHGKFPTAYNSVNGETIGEKISASAGLLALAAVTEFADATTEGLRIGSLTERNSAIKNLEIEGSKFDIEVGRAGLRIVRDAKLILETNKPTVIQRFRLDNNEAAFSTTAYEPGTIRFGPDREITSAVMDNKIQVLSEGRVLRCPPGTHEFRVTFKAP